MVEFLGKMFLISGDFRTRPRITERTADCKKWELAMLNFWSFSATDNFENNTDFRVEKSSKLNLENENS